MSSSSDSNQKLCSIDLKSFIEQYTWERFRAIRKRWKMLVRLKKKYYVDILWGYLQFKHKTNRFDLRHETKSGVPETQAVDLYKSDYENKTAISQQYTFSANRETRSSVSVEVQDTYTLGGSTNLEIDLAGFGKLGGGFSQSFSVTNATGETFEKSLSWEVNTEVRVKPWHKTIASLCVYELNKVYDFEVKTTLSLPQRCLPVAIRRKKDNKTVWEYLILRLPVIFDKNSMTKHNIVVEMEDRIEENRRRENIVFTTHGVCKIKSWTEQHVKVESEEMENIPEHIKNALKNEKED